MPSLPFATNSASLDTAISSALPDSFIVVILPFSSDFNGLFLSVVDFVSVLLLSVGLLLPPHPIRSSACIKIRLIVIFFIFSSLLIVRSDI